MKKFIRTRVRGKEVFLTPTEVNKGRARYIKEKAQRCEGKRKK